MMEAICSFETSIDSTDHTALYPKNRTVHLNVIIISLCLWSRRGSLNSPHTSRLSILFPFSTNSNFLDFIILAIKCDLHKSKSSSVCNVLSCSLRMLSLPRQNIFRAVCSQMLESTISPLHPTLLAKSVIRALNLDKTFGFQRINTARCCLRYAHDTCVSQIAEVRRC
jgi:hypothetical protein